MERYLRSRHDEEGAAGAANSGIAELREIDRLYEAIQLSLHDSLVFCG